MTLEPTDDDVGAVELTVPPAVDEVARAIAEEIVKLEEEPVNRPMPYGGLYEIASRHTQPLRAEMKRLNRKWQDYEQNYILTTFPIAKEMGLDLQKMVMDNPGKNCVILLIDALRTRLAEVEAERAAQHGRKELSCEFRRH